MGGKRRFAESVGLFMVLAASLVVDKEPGTTMVSRTGVKVRTASSFCGVLIFNGEFWTVIEGSSDCSENIL